MINRFNPQYIKKIISSRVSTYDKKDFYYNWHKINRNLGARWDAVVKNSPHKDLKKPTLTDLYFAKAIIKLLSRWIPKRKKSKVLKFDLYNEATMTATLADWFLKQGYDYYGIDISKEVVRLARKNFSKRINTSNFKVGDVRDLPFKDSYFDVVFSFGTIEHIRENEQAVKEAYRVLKPGGIFITGINNKLDMWFSYFVNELTDQLLKHITSYEPSYFPWEQRKWLENAGFEKITTTGMITFPHLIRYGDLFVEWRQVNGTIRTFWDNLIIKPFISLAEILDNFKVVRFFGMHTTSYGYKPENRKSKRH